MRFDFWREPGSDEIRTQISIEACDTERRLALSQQELEELVSALSSSLGPVELSPEWSSEIGRRIQKIERGAAELHAEEHLALLRQKHSD